MELEDIYILGDFCVNQNRALTFEKGKESLEISKYIIDSADTKIELKLVSTPRNIFGPFHERYDKCSRSSFKNYRTINTEYTNDYILESMGIMESVMISDRP